MGLEAFRPEAVVHVVMRGETDRQEVGHAVHVFAEILSLHSGFRERQQILVAKGCPGERLVILLPWLGEAAGHGVRELRAQGPLIGMLGAVVSRRTGYDAAVTGAVLRAGIQACSTCADECEIHAAHGMEHCRVCAEECRRCEQACQELLAAIA